MKVAILGLVLAGLLAAQGPGAAKKAEFEVASIRVSTPDNSHDTSSDHEWFRTHNISLKRLIATAYQIDAGQVYGGPSWVDADGFYIKAKIPAAR